MARGGIVAPGASRHGQPTRASATEMRRSGVKTQLDRDSPIAAVLRVVAQKQWAGLVASLGSRSGTGRTNKRLFTWVWPCCTTRVSQNGSTHFAESGEPTNSSRPRGRSPQIGGVFIGFDKIWRRCVRADNKRTIDLLSSVDFEVQVRRDHLARAIRTIEKGPSTPELELGAHYSAMRPSIRRRSCCGRRWCMHFTRFDCPIRICRKAHN